MPRGCRAGFTANPEDYTNRGNIITPLKDRIDSQVLTHYPRTVDEGIAITVQEAWTDREEEIEIPRFLEEVIEEVAFIARESEHVDQSSGVSQRLPIRARELILSAVERRCLVDPDEPRVPRLCDLAATLPAITGRIELVYEGEQEGSVIVANRLLGRAMLKVFGRYFPPVYKRKGRARISPDESAEEAGDGQGGRVTPAVYREILDFFSSGGKITLRDSMTAQEYGRALGEVPGLAELVDRHLGTPNRFVRSLAAEWVLESLHQVSLIARQNLDGGSRFSDMLANMFSEEESV